MNEENQMIWKLIHELQDDNEQITNQINEIHTTLNHINELLSNEQQYTIEHDIEITNIQETLNKLTKKRSNHT